MNNTLLSNIYYNPSSPAGFSTADKLYQEAKLKNGSIKLKDVKDWLSGQLTYTLHKPLRRRFNRCKIISSKPNEQWQADLVDLQKFSKNNDGYKYLLTIIDIFSKYAFVVPIKSKSGKNIKDAFELVFKDRFPSKIQTDRGKEFVNSEFKKFLKSRNISLFHSNNNEIKCSIIERFNKTLKSKMFKYFTSKGITKYLDVLPKIVQAYNNTKHRTTKYKPVDVKFENKDEVFRNMYGFKNKRELLKYIYNKQKYKIGDKVRIKYNLETFDRGYYPNWSDQIFTIVKINNKLNQCLYRLKDENENVLEKRFYEKEIQKVKENLFRIEKIIKRRRLNGRSEAYVKWLNYPDSFNSWIDIKDIVKL